MGDIGRLIKEGEWPHSADWNSWVFAALNICYILPHGDDCEPELILDPGYHPDRRVEIGSGKVCFGVPDVHDFAGAIVEPDGNIGEAARYDLIYLTYETGSVVAKISKGTPSLEPKHPDITFDMIPIAVVYFAGDTDEVTALKDCRSVMDAEHNHSAGAGLSLVDGVMSVSADETTISVANDYVELMDGAVTYPKLGFTIGPGLEFIDTTSDGLLDTMRCKLGFALEFDGSDRIAVNTSALAGVGLEVGAGDKLDVIAGDGLQITATRLRVTEGQGVILRGTTPNRQIDVYTRPAGGLDFVGDELYVKVSDVAGAGLEDDGSNNLRVRAGNGLTIDATGVTIDPGRGIIFVGDKVGINHVPGGGIEFDGVGTGRMYVDASVAAGSGLHESAGKLHVKYGDGVKSGTGTAVTVDTGSGLHLNNPGGEPAGEYLLEVHPLTNGGLEFDASDRLAVKPADFVGDGLEIDGDGKIQVAVGDGLKFDISKRLTIDYDFGLEMISNLLCVNPYDFEGFGTKAYTDGGIKKLGGDLDAYLELVVDQESYVDTGAGWTINGFEPCLVTYSLTEVPDLAAEAQYLTWHMSQIVWPPEDPTPDDSYIVWLFNGGNVFDPMLPKETLEYKVKIYQVKIGAIPW